MKSALHGTLIYSIPLIAQRLVGIALLSVVTRVLTPDDYGMLMLMEQVGIILATLLGGHFAAALGYFYCENDSRDHRARVTGTAVAGAFAVGWFATLACLPANRLLARYVFGSPDALRYLPVFLLAFPFNFAYEAICGWFRVNNRPGAFAACSLLRILITAAGIGILVGILKFHVMAYMVTSVAALAIPVAVFGIYLLRSTPVAWSFPLFWRMFRFSLPLSLSWIAMFVINYGDQFVLRHYRSLAEVGIYGLAYRISMLVNFALSSFFAYWSAQVYQILRREDARTVFARFLTYCMLLVTFAALALVLGCRPGLRILVAPAFWPAAAIVPILVAANSLRAIGEFLRCRFLAAGRPRYDTFCNWGAMAICVALYMLLIPRYGMWGAGWATFFTFILLSTLSFVWTYRMQSYDVECGRLLKLAAVATGILVLYYAVPVSALYLQVAWSALLLASFPLGLLVLRFPTPGEMNALRSFVGRYLPQAAAAGS
jgi:O-antigen/teichoic acid export membrane protein